jgi:hypothetical protein
MRILSLIIFHSPKTAPYVLTRCKPPPKLVGALDNY